METSDPYPELPVARAADAETRRARTASRKAARERREAADAARHVNADNLTNAYWKKYGHATLQRYPHVRKELREILERPNLDPREVGEAVVRIGKQNMMVTRGTVQVELNKMQRERERGQAGQQRAAARKRITEDHEGYTVGFNGEKVISI